MPGVLEMLTCTLSACGLVLVFFLTVVTYACAMGRCVDFCDRVFDRFKSRSRLAGFLQGKSIAITAIVFIVATFCAVILLNRVIEKTKGHVGTGRETGVQTPAEVSGNTSTADKAIWLLHTQHLRAKKF